MDNINIINILKFAPIDKIKLYSVLHGRDLIFHEISDNNIIMLDGENVVKFTSNGAWFENGECMLFPDKQYRDWSSGWHYWVYRYSEGSVIIDHYNNPYLYIGDYYYPVNPQIPGNIIRSHKKNLTNSRYANPDETEQYFKELSKNGFIYDKLNNKIIEFKFKLIPGKYYICKKSQMYFKKGKAYICADENCLIDYYGAKVIISLETFNECFYKDPWTLDNAKTGDILTDEYGIPFIYKKIEGNKDIIYAFCGLSRKTKKFIIPNDNEYWFSKHNINFNKIHPATNKEKEELFIAMNNAGYKWENYSLKHIDKRLKRCKNPEVGMLVKHDPKYYSDPFNMHDKEEYLNRVYIITSVEQLKVTIAPINTRSVVTLNFYNVDDACPINLDRQEIAQQYYIVEDEVIYDAKFLETWDHVLVKNMNNEEWKIANFSYLQEENSKYKFICDNGKYNICIPWNAATKHLVGTKDTPIPIYNIKVE